MKKVFISQPMKDRTNEELQNERKAIIDKLVDRLGESVEVLDNLFGDKYPNEKPLWHLGESLKLLSSADLAVFAEGWEKARGCRIEHECAIKYDVQTMDAFDLFFTFDSER